MRKAARAGLKGGYTFVEIVVAMFIFTTAMSIIANVFAATFSSYRHSRMQQQNLEKIQQLNNLMAKEIRTSSIVGAEGNGHSAGDADGYAATRFDDSDPIVYFFDYSKGECIGYQFIESQGKLYRNSASTTVSNCRSSFSTLVSPTNGRVVAGGIRRAVFKFAQSREVGGDRRVGFFAATFQPEIPGVSQPTPIQMFVSLRDYEVSEFLVTP